MGALGDLKVVLQEHGHLRGAGIGLPRIDPLAHQPLVGRMQHHALRSVRPLGGLGDAHDIGVVRAVHGLVHHNVDVDAGSAVLRTQQRLQKALQWFLRSVGES